MELTQFRNYINGALADNQSFKDHLTEDLHYIGARLGRKMTLIRIAFNIFLIGFFASVTLSVIFLFIYSEV